MHLYPVSINKNYKLDIEKFAIIIYKVYNMVFSIEVKPHKIMEAR
jgi:hypothetical protein